MVETLGGCFHSDEFAYNLWKVDPNESGSLDRFAFVKCYVEEEVSLESAEDSERLVGCGCNYSLMDLQ